MNVQGRIDWIRDIVKNSGAAGVALGLSGGKDSAVVATLCHRAGLKIFGTYLPIGNKSEDDMNYVNILLNSFTKIEMLTESEPRVEFLEFNGEDLAEIFNKFSSLVKNNGPESKMALSNIKPRMRMTLLYALAQSRNYLVAGTGNASEGYVGYFTKWGDGAHDFNPIADLLKEEVVQLGRELGIPEECIERTPSAGLWEGQTDEGEMGFKYSDIYEVIKYESLAIHRGVSEETYNKIQKMHRASEHKRNPIPTFKEN